METIVDNNSNFQKEEQYQDPGQILPPIDPKDAMINRLVMCEYEVCMLCGNKDKGGWNEITLGDYMNGWLYCNECLKNQRLTRGIYKYITDSKIIPMQWLLKSDNFNDDTEKNRKCLQFYRYSQKKVQVGFTSYEYAHIIMIFSEKYDMFRLMLLFTDPAISTREMVCRGVSLQNLFAHNPSLYKEFIECDDFLNSGDLPIKIGYKQLNEFMKNKINEAYVLSKNPSDSFLY